MFQKAPTRYYLSAFFILVALIIFPVMGYQSYASGTTQDNSQAIVESYISNWPYQCFFLIALTQFLLLITILRKNKKPQLIFSMLTCIVYGVMLLTAVTALYFDGSYVLKNGQAIPKPLSLSIWLGVAIIGWIFVFLGNRELIKEIKLLDSQNRLR